MTILIWPCSLGAPVGRPQRTRSLPSSVRQLRAPAFAHQPPRHRYLRQALYMPALVAVGHDPYLGGFYLALLERHKKKPQALVAVARKILQAIYGMFRHDCGYEGSRLFPRLAVAAA